MKEIPLFPDSEKLGAHLMKLFEKDDIKESFQELQPVLRDCICARVWAMKGKCLGIHNDFGLHSYL